MERSFFPKLLWGIAISLVVLIVIPVMMTVAIQTDAASWLARGPEHGYSAFADPSGHLVPAADGTYDLGENSTPLRWRDLWLSRNLRLVNGGAILLDTSAGARIQDGGAEVIALRDSTNTRGINVTLTAAGNQTIAASAGNLAIPSITDFQANSIGATPTDRILLSNTTAAAVGAQQYSPALRLTGRGWDSGASASQAVDMRMYLVPTEEPDEPSADLYIDYSVDGSAFTRILRLRRHLLSGGVRENVQLMLGQEGTTATVGIHYVATIATQAFSMTGNTQATGMNIGITTMTATDQVTKTGQSATIEIDKMDVEASGGAVQFNKVTSILSRFPIANHADVTIVDNINIDIFGGDTHLGAVTNSIGLNFQARTWATNNYGIMFLDKPNGGSIATAAGVDLLLGVGTGHVEIAPPAGEDPALLMTVNGSTTWYIGVPDDATDNLFIGTGTTVGSDFLMRLRQETTGNNGIAAQFEPLDFTANNSASAGLQGLIVTAATLTYSGTTQVTTLRSYLNQGVLTLTQSGGAVVVNEVAGASFAAPTLADIAITLTDGYGIYVRNATKGSAATYTRQHGIYIEDLTAGGSDYGITIEGADTAAIWVQSADPVLLGTAGAATGVLQIAGATSGVVSVTVAAAAGTWTMTLPAAVGTAGFQLTDAGGDGVTSWAAAASNRSHKTNISQILNPSEALNAILGTKVYSFNYLEGYGTGDTLTQYVGPMADEVPWAMHYNGGILNPINAFGYTILAIQAQNDKVEELERKLEILCGLYTC